MYEIVGFGVTKSTVLLRCFLSFIQMSISNQKEISHSPLHSIVYFYDLFAE